jgi:hypothetical protein
LCAFFSAPTLAVPVASLAPAAPVAAVAAADHAEVMEFAKEMRSDIKLLVEAMQNQAQSLRAIFNFMSAGTPDAESHIPAKLSAEPTSLSVVASPSSYGSGSSHGGDTPERQVAQDDGDDDVDGGDGDDEEVADSE